MAAIDIAVYEHKQGPSLSENGRFVAYPWVDGQCLWLRVFGDTEQEAYEKCLQFTRAELDRTKRLGRIVQAPIKPEPAKEAEKVSLRGKALVGTKWMKKDGTRKRVPMSEVEAYLEDGWSLGKA